ncbi:hypothetical protein HMPREF1145_1966 [Oribacterium parvum ACB8]|nr:hypothetical protein HMPREF1145_1966 [Oribacterium parvum ACB8]
MLKCKTSLSCTNPLQHKNFSFVFFIPFSYIVTTERSTYV